MLKRETAEGTLVAVSIGVVGLRGVAGGADRGVDADLAAGGDRGGPRGGRAVGVAGGDPMVELRARAQRDQRERLQYLAPRNETTIDEVLTRELEDVACAHAEELSRVLPGFAEALAWPEHSEG